MSLNNPASRSALRSLVFAGVILAMIAFAYIFSYRLTSEDGLRESLRYAFLIILVGTLGYVTENGIRSIKAKGLLGDIELNADDVPSGASVGAQVTAAAAQNTADQITEQSKG